MTKSSNGQSTRVENRLKAQFAKHMRHLAYGFDRLDFLMDASSPDLDWARLKQHCGDLELLDHKDSFHPIWMKELRVYQPDPDFPWVLMKEVGSRYNLKVQYVEAACDLITKTPEKAEILLRNLIRHLLLRQSRSQIVKDRSVYYWAGRKAATNLAAYADKPSKIHSPWAGRSCAHMELRIRGTEGLNRFGIYGVSDLLLFKHRSTWDLVTSFAFVPSMTALGHLLRDGEDVADDTALRAFDKYMEECNVEGHPSLHNAVVTNRRVRKALQMISHRELFGRAR